MVDSTPSAKNHQMVQRANQILSGIVASAVLGVGGVMAYQNRDAIKAPDRNAAWANFWQKKMPNKSGFPDFEAPEFKQTIDWEKNAIDPSKFPGPGFQYNPAQCSNGGNTSASSNRRRR